MNVPLALAAGAGIGVVALIISALASLTAVLDWIVGRPPLVTIRVRRVAFFAALFWFWYMVPIVARIP